MEATANIQCLFLIFFSLFVAYKAKDVEVKRVLSTKSLCPSERPECSSNETHVNLIHTTAVGPNDTFHYVFSTYGTPSFLVACTDLGAELEIDWDKFFSKDIMNTSKSLHFKDGSVHYAYSLLFNNLIEYNDVDDTADLNATNQSPKYWLFHDLSALPWENASAISNLSNNEVLLSVTETKDKLKFNKGGSLTFKINSYGWSDRSESIPHLAFTSNTTQFDLILNNLTSNFAHSRFALEMSLVAGNKEADDLLELTSTRSIDDEHTPGVFELIDWTSEGANQTSGAYLQWKPVCYMAPSRAFQKMNRAKMYHLHRVNQSLWPEVRAHSVAYAYFGEDMFDQTLTTMSATNVSFGLSKDKFYVNANYTVWSASLGFGTPPQDAMSSMIIIIISIGLGLPAAFIIFGGLGVCIKKRRELNSSPYTSIN